MDIKYTWIGDNIREYENYSYIIKIVINWMGNSNGIGAHSFAYNNQEDRKSVKILADEAD